MQIGPDHWSCVTINGIGVPKAGSQWGRPKWFAEKIAKRGLTLMWSRAYERFCIAYRASPGRYVFEMWLSANMDPWGTAIPCNMATLQVVLDLWNRHKATGTATIKEALAQLQRDEARERYEASTAQGDEDHDEVMDYVALQNKHRTPMAVADLGQAHNRAERRRLEKAQRRQRRGRILLPGGVN